MFNSRFSWVKKLIILPVWTQTYLLLKQVKKNILLNSSMLFLKTNMFLNTKTFFFSRTQQSSFFLNSWIPEAIYSVLIQILSIFPRNKMSKNANLVYFFHTRVGWVCSWLLALRVFVWVSVFLPLQIPARSGLPFRRLTYFTSMLGTLLSCAIIQFIIYNVLTPPGLILRPS